VKKVSLALLVNEENKDFLELPVNLA